MLPEGDWETWLILAGRGFGKTRTGAETVRHWVKSHRYVNLIGPTIDDAQKIMVEGESGIMNICSNADRPRHVGRELQWPNGAISRVFTADEPERLRGPQHEKIWADELASWRYPESWDQAQLGLRIGSNPQAVVTTTPKPIPLLKALIADPTTKITRGTSYDNRENLSPKFYAKVIRKYEDTRLGQQELYAQLLDDNPAALWSRAMIERNRVRVAPEGLKRIVIGLDPSTTDDETSSEAGIIAAGLGADNHAYILNDASLAATPTEWARIAVESYRMLKADRIIGETNNGGDMIEALIRVVDANVAYTKVTASRGKITRAEPIAALYEQGRVHHVGYFAELEDQMCEYDPITSKKSPDRMDGLVWALTHLFDDTNLAMLNYYRELAAKQAQQQPTSAYSQPRVVTGFPGPQ